MCSSDAPDTSGANAAAVQQAALSKEQLDWAKEIYKETAPDRANAIQRANQVSDAQLDAMKDQSALTKDYADYNKNTFRPLEQGIVADATGYDTPERRAAESANAMAGVSSQFDIQRASMARDAAARGVDPSSGNFAASMGSTGVTEAASKASAGNLASKQVETIGQARKMDAANLGRNLASNQATSAGVALNQGNSSVANAQVPGAVTAQGNAMMTSGYAGAQAGLAGAGQTYNGIASIQQKAAENSGMFGALGTMAGQFAGSQAGSALIASAFSDVNMKEDIKPVDPDKALKAVESTPVSNWAYKGDTKGDDGGQRHTGPMAQDVQKNMGEKVGPNGKKIDLISMNGIAMAAIQGLSKKIDRVMAAQGIPMAS